MRVTVVRPGDLGSSEASLWAAFQRSSPATLISPMDTSSTSADGYQQYLSSRKKVSTKRITEKRRALKRRLGTLSLQWSSPSPQQHLRQLIDWKAAKYGGARQLFSDPAARRILEELTTESADDCRGLLSVLSAGERTVALFFGLIAHGGLCSWFPTYNRELSRYSPGRMMWQPLAEQAASLGVTRLDLGYGQDQYKFGLANASYLVAGGAVWASRCEQAVRSAYRRLHGRGSRAPGPAGEADSERGDMAETAW